MRSVARQFAEAVTATPEGGMVMGTVTSVNADMSLDVDVRGSALTGIRYLSHVAPRPGYGVWLQRVGDDLLAVGVPAQVGWPACRVRRNADSSTYASGTQIVTFDTVVSDVWDMWNGGTNVVIPIPGLYDLAGSVQFDGNSTGTFRGASIKVDGAEVAWNRPGLVASASATILPAAAGGLPLAAGAIVTLYGEHSASTNRYHVGGAEYRSSLSVTYRGPIGA